ncbi:gametogenetin-like [Salvia splendens]|uniref:gametogenetin-like n=1 Tax=Salvia splendens TaxID=180675 RepID=UPI001C268D3E|nr:gametogenetin-like [Salvia splendens]
MLGGRQNPRPLFTELFSVMRSGSWGFELVVCQQDELPQAPLDGIWRRCLAALAAATATRLPEPPPLPPRLSLPPPPPPLPPRLSLPPPPPPLLPPAVSSTPELSRPIMSDSDSAEKVGAWEKISTAEMEEKLDSMPTAGEIDSNSTARTESRHIPTAVKDSHHIPTAVKDCRHIPILASQVPLDSQSGFMDSIKAFTEKIQKILEFRGSHILLALEAELERDLDLVLQQEESL